MVRLLVVLMAALLGEMTAATWEKMLAGWTVEWWVVRTAAAMVAMTAALLGDQQAAQ